MMMQKFARPSLLRAAAGIPASASGSRRHLVSKSAPSKKSAMAEESAVEVTNNPVNSHNEWDLLEEVIIGRVEGATIPEYHVAGKAVWPSEHHDFFRSKTGQLFDPVLIQKASEELDYLSHVLEQEGVVVTRPELLEEDFTHAVQTPDFASPTGLYAAMPRDILITIGNEIIEAPMAWRSRFFEYRPYRSLVKDLFRRGGKWTAAPKPLMSDDLYDNTWEEGIDSFVTTEFEPVFDAAEFTRVGRDIFTQRSQVTNMFGIEWMQRHLGDDYNIHVLDFQDKNAMHIDGTFIPLGPGQLLVNPKRPCVTGSHKTWYTFNGEEREYRLPEMFKGWDVFFAPTPMLPQSGPGSVPLYFTSPWTATANVLLLGDKRVICEAQETETMKRFEEWGFHPIPVPFRHFLPFGGSFHCASCDVRRAGVLESYF